MFKADAHESTYFPKTEPITVEEHNQLTVSFAKFPLQVTQTILCQESCPELKYFYSKNFYSKK